MSGNAALRSALPREVLLIRTRDCAQDVEAREGENLSCHAADTLCTRRKEFVSQ
jgi:hypothetical protein